MILIKNIKTQIKILKVNIKLMNYMMILIKYKIIIKIIFINFRKIYKIIKKSKF